MVLRVLNMIKTRSGLRKKNNPDPDQWTCIRNTDPNRELCSKTALDKLTWSVLRSSPSSMLVLSFSSSRLSSSASLNWSRQRADKTETIYWSQLGYEHGRRIMARVAEPVHFWPAPAPSIFFTGSGSSSYKKEGFQPLTHFLNSTPSS